MNFIELVDIEEISETPHLNMVDIQVGIDETFILTNGLISHNSAIAGLVAARDPEIHGGLPLRGKPMNVREEVASAVLKNEVLAKVMATIGLVPGVRPNRDRLRYGSVYITTDADEDGKNIAALLVNFFYTFWKDLFDPGYPPFIYIFDTPLIIAVKGKVRKFWYNDNIDTFNGDDYKGWEITRAKGLAALKKEDWKQILVNPKLIPITDDGELDQALDLLFNKDKASADKRKVWIGM
jgi:DNA gyrase/topoisomerase IV subunit B